MVKWGVLLCCISGVASVCRHLHVDLSLHLDCSFTGASSIQTPMPPSTLFADFSSNNIRNLSKRDILISDTLQTLLLNNNNIENISTRAFEGLPELAELDLSHNKLSNLAGGIFHGVFKLEVINLASNNLKALPLHLFKQFSLLRELNLNHNNLAKYFCGNHDSIFTINPDLSILHIRNVNFSDIPQDFFTSARNLKELTLAENPIRLFPTLPYMLEVLDLSRTQVSSITAKDFLNLPALRELKLNGLSKLKDIGNYTFHSLKGLRKLELQNCKNLTTFSPSAFGILNEDVDYEFPLSHISFLGSGLSELDVKLSVGFNRLTSLDLRGNPWSCDCNTRWLWTLNVDPRLKQVNRCSQDRCEEKVSSMSWQALALVVLCLLLAGLAVWLVLLWPPPV